MPITLTTAKISTLTAGFTLGMTNLPGLTPEARTRTVDYCRQITAELDRRTAPAAGYSLATRRRCASLYNQFSRELRLAELPAGQTTLHPFAEAINRVATKFLGAAR